MVLELHKAYGRRIWLSLDRGADMWLVMLNGFMTKVYWLNNDRDHVVFGA
jgi:hypothetical protein